MVALVNHNDHKSYDVKNCESDKLNQNIANRLDYVFGTLDEILHLKPGRLQFLLQLAYDDNHILLVYHIYKIP
jgi:hypothetical protein